MKEEVVTRETAGSAEVAQLVLLRRELGEVERELLQRRQRVAVLGLRHEPLHLQSEGRIIFIQ